MNMKKTFAGAMAGALAVSAMATSASAAIPGPGEYTVDLTKDGNFKATVQFTFDADYILEDTDGYIATTLTSLDTALFDLRTVNELKFDFVGSAGTTTQTLVYNETWADVNYYGDIVNSMDNTGKNANLTWYIPVNGVFDKNNGYGTMAGLYTDKYKTVKNALAVSKSNGDKKYPAIWTGVDSKNNDIYADDTNNVLDKTYFDKIVVTAKLDLGAKKNLSELNATWGKKGALTASISKDDIKPIDIYEIDDTDVAASKATLKALNDAKLKFAVYQALAAKVTTADDTALNTAKADLATAKTTFDAATLDGAATTGADVKVGTDSKVAITTVGSDSYVELTAGGSVKLDATGKTAVDTYNAAAQKVADEQAKYDKADADSKASTKAAAEAKEAYEKVLTDAGLPKYSTDAEFEAAIDKAEKEANGSATFVGVKIVDANPVAETLFTSASSDLVGVKSGIFVDGAVWDYANSKYISGTGTVKTVSADIGAWKPDALRQIRDAIADNSGVTLTFTAKNNFDDAAYRDWLHAVSGSSVNWTATSNKFGTTNVKDDYDPWGVSMFTGAIVLNRDFSKQFSAAGLVDWGTNTITFDWDELTEGRFYDASVVLHSLELLSTQNVEWVSCTVTVPEQEAASDTADSSQGKTEDPDEIETTPVETEVITEAPVETEAPATEAPAETTPVAPVENIPTGNAPVALAVIPVALAAAAVIAKKRG